MIFTQYLISCYIFVAFGAYIIAFCHFNCDTPFFLLVINEPESDMGVLEVEPDCDIVCETLDQGKNLNMLLPLLWIIYCL